MARINKNKKRLVQPDFIYNNRLVTRLINKVMKSGKKTVATQLVYNALEKLKKQSDNDPIKILETAIKNAGPRLEVRSRRVGGAAYQVPTEVRGDRKVHLALKWIIEAARARSNKEFHNFDDKLAAELLLAYKEEGGAIKKRDAIHKMADANKAFAHFRW